MYNQFNKIKGKSKFSDDVLNKHIKEKIGHLNDLKKQFGYDQELINKLALMNVALKENSIEIDNLFYDTLMKTEIFQTSGNLEKLYKTIIDKDEERDLTAIGMYFSDLDDFNFTDDYVEYKSKILVAEKYGNHKIEKYDFYDTLIHEVRHALTSQINKRGFLDDGTYFKRSGLEVRYKYKDDNEYIYKYGSMIDEVFNEEASTDLLNTILRYKNNSLDNNNLKHLLEDPEAYLINGKFQSCSYSIERNFLKPLLNNKEIVEMAYKSAYNGKIEDFYNIFPNFYKYSDDFEELLDKFYDNGESKEVKNFKKEFNVITKKIAKFNI